jgi:hypothetical protein
MAMINNNHSNDDKYWTSSSSPKRAPSTQQVLPDSPDYIDKYATNSDDLQPTSNLHSSSLYSSTRRRAQPQQPLVIVGSHAHPVTLGRGGACTVKIGRRNRQISRIHVSIAFNTNNDRFELTVVGLNGACVDDVHYEQHAVAPLEEDSFVDVLGDQFRFRIPPPVSSTRFVEKLIKEEQDVQVKKMKFNTDILREMSPEAEQSQQEKKEEEEADVVVEEEEEKTKQEDSFPVELVSEEALSPMEKESSPEQEEEEEEEKPVLQEMNQVVEQDTHDYAEVIIDALGKKKKKKNTLSLS